MAFLFDKENHWIHDIFIKKRLILKNYSFEIFFYEKEVSNFDIVFILGYTKILPAEFFERNRLNLVVHESDLPKGKGFAPVQWQLLEGSSEITVSLIEAVNKVDSGDIFLQKKMNFDGTELYDEIRSKQADTSLDIITDFLKSYPKFTRRKQEGVETFYPKRTMKDGELEMSKTLEQNFNLLRVSNNEEWPSFFHYRGNKYLLKIFKE